jgi:predicted transcriptional regulator of viral defense system
MSHFDDIYEVAADNYGLITAAQARDLGVTRPELGRWVAGGRLERRGRGVYKLVRYVPTDLDPYAEAVALVGDGSFLTGEAVLAMHGLALVNPRRLPVGTPDRIRRSVPDWIAPKTVRGKSTTQYEGIPSQTVAEAILDCRGSVMPERLRGAAEAARERGLVTKAEYEQVKEGLSGGTWPTP